MLRFTLKLVLVLIAVAASNSAHAESYFLKKEPDSRQSMVIVFVHGLMGSANETWGEGDTIWPKMMRKDPTFDKADFFVASYSTKLWADSSISEIATNFHDQLVSENIQNYEEIIFIVHSMGGLVTRATLVRFQDVLKKVKFIYFFATPTNGSDVASLASLLSSNPHLGQMKPIQSDGYLADLLTNWLAIEDKIPSFCAYEKKPLYGRIIVPFASAASLCTRPPVGIDENHSNIVKPRDTKSGAYMAFKSAFNIKVSPSKELRKLKENILDVLVSIRATHIIKTMEFYPAFDIYLEKPNEGNWRQVQDIAESLIKRIEAAVERAIAFDSQFVNLGGNVVGITDDAKSFLINTPKIFDFQTVTKTWDGQKYIFNTIVTPRGHPGKEKAEEYFSKIKESVDLLRKEMEKYLRYLS